MRFIILGVPPTKDNMEKAYKAIIGICRDNGHTIIDDFIYQNKKDKTKKVSFKKISTEIQKADAVIVEGTESSLDIGRFIASALQYHKPILVLHIGKVAETLADDTHTLLTFKQYDPEKKPELEEDVLKDFFKKVNKKKLLYRFNLMLSRDMNLYLMEKARENRVSKAYYIRKLINTNMDQPE